MENPKYTKDGYNLDLSYITDKLIVLGNFYENDTLSDIRNFLHKQYNGHHTIFNFSNEPEYNIEQDLGNVRNYAFNANNPCALKAMVTFCSEVDAYLNAHPQNVVLFHCRTGN